MLVCHTTPSYPYSEENHSQKPPCPTQHKTGARQKHREQEKGRAQEETHTQTKRKTKPPTILGLRQVIPSLAGGQGLSLQHQDTKPQRRRIIKLCDQALRLRSTQIQPTRLCSEGYRNVQGKSPNPMYYSRTVVEQKQCVPAQG